MDIRFYREESSKELGVKADCSYIVVGKKNGGGWRIFPYSIWYCEDTRCYVAVKVNKYGQAQPKVNTVLDSNDHQESAEAFQTLKDAKEWIYYDIKGSYNGQ